MPRRKRVWYPGATYHVISRGNRKTPIFQDDLDYLYFLEVMQTVREKNPFVIHSICLMTNHFHMLIGTTDTDLSKIMQKILSVYAEEFNYRHHLTGHLFQGRYKAILVRNERYFLEVSRYIHLNPVKAQMVKAPGEYEYSSYGLFVEEGKRRNTKIEELMAELVEKSRVLDYFLDESQEQYRMFVEGKIPHTEEEQMIMKEAGENELWVPV